MNAPSHLAFSLACGCVFAAVAKVDAGSFGANLMTAGCVAATLLGALLPDLDNPQAPAARMMPVVARTISRRFPHRTLLHSFAGLGAASAIVWVLLSLVRLAGAPLGGLVWLLTGFFAWGWLSHMLLDTLSKRGVPYLWPLLPNPFAYPTPYEDRLTSGDKRWELIIVVGSVVLCGLLVPFIQRGANTTLANIIGEVPQLREVYLGAVDHEVAIVFDGYDEGSKARMTGRGLILAERPDLLTLHLNGEVRELGQDHGELRLLSGQVEVLPQAPQVLTLTPFGRPLEDLVTGLGPDSSQVLVSGELASDRPFVLARPLVIHGLSVTATSLRLVFVRRSDLKTVRPLPDGHQEALAVLQDRRTRTQARLDSLITARQQTRDLVVRDRLFKQVQNDRGQLEQVEQALSARTAADTVVRFSGQLSARVIPAF